MFPRVREHSRHHPILVTGLAAVFLLLTVAATWLWAHEGHQALPTSGVLVDAEKGIIVLKDKARRALGIETAEVRREELAGRVSAPATVTAPWRQHAYATARLGGKIAKLHVQPGQEVQRGQPLADVESLELENLQLELLTARNDVQLAAENLKQFEAAHAKGTIPEQTLYEARARHQEALNVLEIARLKLLGLFHDPILAKAELDRILKDPKPKPLRILPIASPIAGVVSHADVQVGQVIEPAQHLFEIVDLSKVWVQVGVLEKDLHQVQPGQPVELHVSAWPRETFRSAVEVKGRYLDPQTHQGTAWAEIVNPPAPPPQPSPARGEGGSVLLPGMFGQAELIVPAGPAMLTVPAGAIIADGAERYVLVDYGGDSNQREYQRKRVVVGRQTADRVQVLQGELVPGDQVVTVGSHELGGYFFQGVLKLSAEAERNIGLQVQPAARHKVAEVVELTGAVDLPPNRRAAVSARLPGTLQRIAVDRDQPVKAGDLVAEVFSPEFHNLQLELLRSHLQLDQLEQTLKRLRPLAEQRNPALSLRLLRETESAYFATLQRRDSHQRKLEAVGLSEEQVQRITDKHDFVAAMPVKAPIDGFVVRFRGVLGQAVKAEEPLFEIHDLGGALVRGYVSERHLSAVRIGQNARVRLLADPDFEADAVVVRSGQVFESEDRTLSIWARLETSAKPRVLLHGMLARLALVVSESEPTLAVPRDAILRDGLRSYLFIRNPEGIFERRPVQTGRGDDRFIEITRGLTAGEMVAVGGVAGLQTAYGSLK